MGTVSISTAQVLPISLSRLTRLPFEKGRWERWGEGEGEEKESSECEMRTGNVLY